MGFLQIEFPNELKISVFWVIDLVDKTTWNGHGSSILMNEWFFQGHFWRMFDQLTNNSSFVDVNEWVIAVNEKAVCGKVFSWLDLQNVSCFYLGSFCVDPLCDVTVMMVNFVVVVFIFPVSSFSEGEPVCNSLKCNWNSKHENECNFIMSILICFFEYDIFLNKYECDNANPKVEIEIAKDISSDEC